jgi:hypothetical protein
MEEKRCLICGEGEGEGLHISGEFICLRCEQRIVESKVSDRQYDRFRQSLKVLWEENTQRKLYKGIGPGVSK